MAVKELIKNRKYKIRKYKMESFEKITEENCNYFYKCDDFFKDNCICELC